jgi:hypothetical protein
MIWAFNRGKSGANELYDDTTALDIGHLVHSTIEAELNGDPVPDIPAEFKDRVGSALEAWHEWWESNNLTVIATEKVTRKSLTDEDQKRLVEDALTEVDFTALSGNGEEAR